MGLARAIALEVLGQACVRVPRPQPATLLGRGAVEQTSAEIRAHEPDVVIVDAGLSPIQQRNLEQRWQVKVIDRTGLILEIFGERARTREGQLQVDLAHLSYQRSRLVRSWTHLERQRGGAGFMGGPGERQIELDRRQIDDRIVHIKRELESVRRTRSLHRGARARVPYPVVALVGYTNAGKSTLFNRLTAADVMAQSMLFATLDPTMRQVDLDGGRRIILSDTVGFIADLPTHLVAAFRATLEEVQNADLVVHVRDIAHPDSEAQRDDVARVLKDLGIDTGADSRIIEAWNKIDALPAAKRDVLLRRSTEREDAVAISARTGDGCERLRRFIADRINADRDIVDLRVDLSDGGMLAWLYRRGEIVERQDDEKTAHLKVRLDPANQARLRHRQEQGQGTSAGHAVREADGPVDA